MQVTGDGDKSEGRAIRRYYAKSNTRKRMRYQLYRIRCQNRYGNFTRQHSTSLILQYSTLIASTLHKLTLPRWWSYSTLTWLSRLNVGSQIDRYCPLANPSHSDDRTIDQILADFPRILSRTEDLSVRWNIISCRSCTLILLLRGEIHLDLQKNRKIFYSLIANSIGRTQCALVHVKDVVHKVDVKICV